jgi:hypothetical protein
MKTLTSSPPEVKNGPFSEKATKGCHTFLHGEAILLAPLFPHSPFSENPFSDLREGVTTPSVLSVTSPNFLLGNQQGLCPFL